jgi:3-methyladenine DNA glycosylase/8-oxoguanine DNA glycosylase
MINAHGWPQLAPFTWDAEQAILGRVEQLTTGIVVGLAISVSEAEVAITVDGPDLSTADLREIEARVRWMIELDEDYTEFYAFCQQEVALHHIPRQGLGPMLRGATVWEDYVKTICTTNTTWAQTRGMVARIVAAWGSPAGSSGPFAFPSAEAIASTSVDDFAANARVGYRAPYIHATAVDLAEERLDLEEFKQRAREVDTATLMKELRRLRGVGSYAAAHLALLLGSYGHVPADSWARTLVRRHFMAGAEISDANVHAHFAGFGRWKALAFRCWDWDSLPAATPPLTDP